MNTRQSLATIALSLLLACAIDANEPGFADKFRTPDSPSQTGLLTDGDAFVLELDKAGVAAKFIA